MFEKASKWRLRYAEPVFQILWPKSRIISPLDVVPLLAAQPGPGGGFSRSPRIQSVAQQNAHKVGDDTPVVDVVPDEHFDVEI